MMKKISNKKKLLVTAFCAGALTAGMGLAGTNINFNTKGEKMEVKSTAEINLEKGQVFLADNKAKSDVVTTQSGLQYKVVQKGEGESPKASDTVTVNYEGSLINGTVFDSSYKRGETLSFPVGGVISGWQEALQLMKPGATWMVYIPSNLAYGQRGAPGSIGPNEALIFKIELVSVKK